jgi:methionyl-tRNA formyltransferase
VVIVSMGMAFVKQIAGTLRELGHEPVALITRARNLEARTAAAANVGLNLLVPADRSKLLSVLALYTPDVVICAGFPWRFSPAELATPRLGVLNVHNSLLPRYRGPNPVGWALRNGDNKIGMTIDLMDENFDTGPIMAQASAPLLLDDDYDSLSRLVKLLLPDLIEQALARLQVGDFGDAQDDAAATYAGLFEDQFATVDWSRSALEVHNQVRSWSAGHASVGGLLGALAELDGVPVRLLRSQPAMEIDSGLPAGTSLPHDRREERLVQCGRGALRIVEWQELPESQI